MKTLITIITFSIFFLTFSQPLRANTSYNNDKALKGMKQAKVYFDISLNDAQKLLLRMELAQRTIQQIEESGIGVTAVIGIRGGASRFITKADHYVIEEEVGNKKQIQQWIKTFVGQGITIEQCKIAAELFDIAPGDFLPEIEIVRNGYVSLIGYQAQGFGVVPMD